MWLCHAYELGLAGQYRLFVCTSQCDPPREVGRADSFNMPFLVILYNKIVARSFQLAVDDKAD